MKLSNVEKRGAALGCDHLVNIAITSLVKREKKVKIL